MKFKANLFTLCAHKAVHSFLAEFLLDKRVMPEMAAFFYCLVRYCSWRPEPENIRHRIETSFELRLCCWRRKVCPTIASPRAWTRRGRSSASGANDSH